MGRLMRSLGLSWQRPQPRHAEAERIAVWFQDKGRVGRPGSGRRAAGCAAGSSAACGRGWSRIGATDQPRSLARSARRGTPGRNTGAALVPRHVSVAAMTLLLEDVASQLPPGTHAAMLIDNAGWHTVKELRVPPNITLVHLPPCSPGLNAIETQRHRDGVALPARPLPVGPAVRRHARHRRCLLRRLAQPHRRGGTHPLPHRRRSGKTG